MNAEAARGPVRVTVPGGCARRRWAVRTVGPADCGDARQLDSRATLPVETASADRPEVVLPCAAAAAYGEVGAVRPEWWDDELAKLRRVAADSRWRVREIVAQALQHPLEANWPRTVVAVAATGDFAILEELAASEDTDLRWIARQNLGKARLEQWSDEIARVARLLA
jgi:hypothetical protein